MFGFGTTGYGPGPKVWRLKPYQNSPAKHETWLRFQGYTKVITHGVGRPRRGAPGLVQA